MPKETMTSRERWLAVLRRETPDRVPMDYWATGETSRKLMMHLGLSSLEEVFECLHIDRPVFVSPEYVGPPLPKGTNVFGVRHEVADGEDTDAAGAPLAPFSSVEEIEANYTWPRVDWYDFSVIPEQVQGREDRPIVGGRSEPFLRYKTLRGEAQAFMDLVMNPEIVHYCLDKLFDLAYESARRTYEAIPGKVLYSYIAEDMGAQNGLMFSPAHIHEFLLPRMKRMIDLAHSAGAHVFHHNDGACRPILPDMIEAGIAILNPVQWRCKGMEREGLKRDFGEAVVFHGGMDNQYTLPFGTVEEVRCEVLDNLRILGAGGGYILAPCHNLQIVGPAENIVAMYETGYENGWT